MPLVQPEDFQFVGFFRVPSRTNTPPSFAHRGGYAMAFDPAGNGGDGSIFMAGQAANPSIAEISIPTPDGDPAHGLNDFPVATLLQGFKEDPSEGEYGEIYPGGRPLTDFRITGSLVSGSYLLTAWTVDYSGDNVQSASIFRCSKNLSLADSTGPYAFDTEGTWAPEMTNKWFQGAMCHVPAEWQPILGGDAVVGSADRSRVQRNSNGPAFNIFSLADVGVVSPMPIKIGVGYYFTESGNANGPYPFPGYHLACQLDGIAIPKGTRSFITVARYGTGELTGFVGGTDVCYGEATSDPAYIGNPDLDNKCYTLTSSNNTFHAYPYRRDVYIYDLNDIKSVLDGNANPDEVMPYYKGPIPWPEHFSPDDNCQMACCIDNDATPPRLYISMLTADQNDSPVIAVFDIVTGA